MTVPAHTRAYLLNARSYATGSLTIPRAPDERARVCGQLKAAAVNRGRSAKPGTQRRTGLNSALLQHSLQFRPIQFSRTSCG